MNLKSQDKKIQKKEFEAKHNLVGFYNLLLQIDKRNNPQLYRKQANERLENNRDLNNPNA